MRLVVKVRKKSIQNRLFPVLYVTEFTFNAHPKKRCDYGRTFVIIFGSF